jgi:hypothetical protein
MGKRAIWIDAAMWGCCLDDSVLGTELCEKQNAWLGEAVIVNSFD